MRHIRLSESGQSGFGVRRIDHAQSPDGGSEGTQKVTETDSSSSFCTARAMSFWRAETTMLRRLRAGHPVAKMGAGSEEI
jgi:hypothetical protein